MDGCRHTWAIDGKVLGGIQIVRIIKDPLIPITFASLIRNPIDSFFHLVGVLMEHFFEGIPPILALIFSIHHSQSMIAPSRWVRCSRLHHLSIEVI